MTKSQLVDAIAARAPHVPRLQVQHLVQAVFEAMSEALLAGERIELRGFGSFGVKVRPGRVGRNPKTGTRVEVPQRRSLHFTCGKELRERLNKGVVLTAVERREDAAGREPPLRTAAIERSDARTDRAARGEQRPSP